MISLGIIMSWLSARPALGILMLMLMFLLSATGTVIMWATDVFENLVLKTMVLSNVSYTWDWWVVPPVQPLVSVYVFNYTNFECISRNTTFCSRLRVSQVGPYVYSEKNEKVDITFNDDATITYREKKTYEFIPERSDGNPYTDRVFVPNIPYLSAIAKIDQQGGSYLSRFFLKSGLEMAAQPSMVKTTPHELLWGYPDSLVTLGRFSDGLPYDKFGLMVPKANVSVNTVTVDTGANDINRLGLIVRFNNETKDSHWASDECNLIEGSDGSQFPPKLVKPNARLTVYNRDLCRRLPLDYVAEGETQGLPSYRFQMPANVFDSPDKNPENVCFCNKTEDENKECFPSGVSDSSPCSFGAPILMSFPNFYMGDPSLRARFDGMDEPEPEKHESYVNLHQSLGLLLGGHSRLQVNVQVRKGDLDYKGFRNVADRTILPVAWFDVTLDNYPEDVMWMLYHATYTVHIIQLALMYGCLAGAVASAAALCRRLMLKEPKGLILASASTGSFDSDV